VTCHCTLAITLIAVTVVSAAEGDLPPGGCDALAQVPRPVDGLSPGVDYSSLLVDTERFSTDPARPGATIDEIARRWISLSRSDLLRDGLLLWGGAGGHDASTPSVAANLDSHIAAMFPPYAPIDLVRRPGQTLR